MRCFDLPKFLLDAKFVFSSQFQEIPRNLKVKICSWIEKHVLKFEFIQDFGTFGWPLAVFCRR